MKCFILIVKMKINDPAIPFGSTMVVIGANGFIGIETCAKFLQAGYRVRGTVRNVEKHHGWMHKLFDETWPGKFELVSVKDFEAIDAFDQAFEGILQPHPLVQGLLTQLF